MAIARCEVCSLGAKHPHLHPHTPTRDLDLTGRKIYCGAPKCLRPALLWLTDAEEEQYRAGERSFKVIRYRGVYVE